MGSVSEMTKNVINQQLQSVKDSQQLAKAQGELDNMIAMQKIFLSHMAPMLRRPREVGIDSTMVRMQSRLDSDDLAFMRETIEEAKDAAMRETQALATATFTVRQGDNESKAIESERAVVELELEFYANLESSLNEVFSLEPSNSSDAYKEALNKSLTRWGDFQQKSRAKSTSPSQGFIFVRNLDAYAHEILGTLYWRKNVLDPDTEVSKKALIEYEESRERFPLYATAWTGSGGALLTIAEGDFKKDYEAKISDSYKALLAEFDAVINVAQRAIGLTRDDRLILRNGNNIAGAFYNKALVCKEIGDKLNAEQAMREASRWIDSVKGGASRIPSILSTEAEVRIASVVVEEEMWRSPSKTQKQRDEKLEEILDIFRAAKKSKWVYNPKFEVLIESLWIVRRLEILSPDWKDRFKGALELN
jgi:tetratricopeptide (TPR) repeat protein